jgi:hypothetical protein
MIRFYMMPTVGGATGPQDIRMPKYGSDYPGLRIRYFGYEDFCLYSADLSLEQHDALIANADVRALPQDIDAQAGVAGATAAETFLESHKLPGDWILPTMTWRTILKYVTRIFKAMEYFEMFVPRTKLLAAIQLTTTVGTLSQDNQDKLAQAAAQAGVTFTSSDTIRQVLKDIALAVSEEQVRFDIVRL